MDFLSSNSMLMMEKSMGFLWTKQAAILDNIANAETPGYKKKVVTFEEQFRRQLEQARRTNSPRREVREVLDRADEEILNVFEPQESTRMDDNGVNVTEQSVELTRTAYQLQYVMNSINGSLSTLRTVVRGQ